MADEGYMRTQLCEPERSLQSVGFSFDRGECDAMQRRFGIQIRNTWGLATLVFRLGTLGAWRQRKCSSSGQGFVVTSSWTFPGSHLMCEKILLAQCQPKVGEGPHAVRGGQRPTAGALAASSPA